MQKRIGLVFLLVCLLLMMPFSYLSNAAPGTATLYMHCEQLPCYVAKGLGYTRWMKVIPCDGGFGGGETGEQLESIGEDGLEPFYARDGNYTLFLFQFEAISPRINALTPSNWTFHFRAVAANNDSATIVVDWIAIFDDESICPPPAEPFSDEPLWERHIDVDTMPETGVLVEGEQEIDATFGFNETFEISPSDWLVTEFSGNFTSSTLIYLLIDEPIGCDDMCTKITGIEYDLLPLPGSTYWNPTVLAIWQILFPLLVVVSAALLFVTYRGKKLSITDIIIWAIALLILAVIIPIGLNLLYSA